eukprot:155814-Rhodomonas_salina.2
MCGCKKVASSLTVIILVRSESFCLCLSVSLFVSGTDAAVMMAFGDGITGEEGGKEPGPGLFRLRKQPKVPILPVGRRPPTPRRPEAGSGSSSPGPRHLEATKPQPPAPEEAAHLQVRDRPVVLSAEEVWRQEQRDELQGLCEIIGAGILPERVRLR